MDNSLEGSNEALSRVRSWTRDSSPTEAKASYPSGTNSRGYVGHREHHAYGDMVGGDAEDMEDSQPQAYARGGRVNSGCMPSQGGHIMPAKSRGSSNMPSQGGHHMMPMSGDDSAPKVKRNRESHKNGDSVGMDREEHGFGDMVGSAYRGARNLAGQGYNMARGAIRQATPSAVNYAKGEASRGVRNAANYARTQAPGMINRANQGFQSALGAETKNTGIQGQAHNYIRGQLSKAGNAAADYAHNNAGRAINTGENMAQSRLQPMKRGGRMMDNERECHRGGNSVGNWLKGAARTVGRGVEGAARTVGSGIQGAAREVGRQAPGIAAKVGAGAVKYGVPIGMAAMGLKEGGRAMRREHMEKRSRKHDRYHDED
jgi:hypothetical protein